MHYSNNPFIVIGLTGLSQLSFFGTSIIITVSVILETKKLILSKTQENYYMNRVKRRDFSVVKIMKNIRAEFHRLTMPSKMQVLKDTVFVIAAEL